MDYFFKQCLMQINPFITEDDVLEATMINEYDILFKFKNGNNVLYDSFEHTFRHVRQNEEELTEETHKKEFSSNLRKMMNRKFIDQEELARRVGTTQQTISNYITGNTMPSFSMIIKLAKALNCNTDDFYYKIF